VCVCVCVWAGLASGGKLGTLEYDVNMMSVSGVLTIQPMTISCVGWYAPICLSGVQSVHGIDALHLYL
jgi:hypothetical protein